MYRLNALEAKRLPCRSHQAIRETKKTSLLRISYRATRLSPAVEPAAAPSPPVVSSPSSPSPFFSSPSVLVLQIQLQYFKLWSTPHCFILAGGVALYGWPVAGFPLPYPSWMGRHDGTRLNLVSGASGGDANGGGGGACGGRGWW